MGANEIPISVATIFSARPTIEIDGAPVERLAIGLVSISVHESIDGLASLDLSCSNFVSDDRGAGLAFDAGSEVALGAGIRVKAGPLSDQLQIFDGRISALETQAGENEPPTLIVRAEDRLAAARLARRTKIYSDISLDDLAQQVGRELGLQVEVRDLPRAIAVFAQFNESDLAFLRRVLSRYDCTLFMDGETLRVAPRVAVGATIDLTLGSQLRRVHVAADLAHQCTEVTVSGWDAAQGSAFSERANGTQLGSGRGRTGAELFRSSFGERSEHLGAPACVDAAEAGALARAAFDQRARRFVGARGTVEGNPRLRAGTLVSLSGLGQRFDNTYEVQQCSHRFDLHVGYQTDFFACSAFLAAA
jgi:phage protein D